MAKMDAHEKPSRQRTESLPGAAQEGEGVDSLQEHSGEFEAISGAGSVEALQKIMGNDLVLEALSGESMDPMATLIGGELSESIAGQGSGSGAMNSNAAMLKIMRDSSINWEAPALQRLNQMGGGRALPAEKLNRFNEAFKHDFSHVRIHTDAAASQAAEALNAHAFALGAHIFFGKGTYGDGRAADRLLAHELTHVVQHDEGRLPSSSSENEVSNPSDPSEQEAYANEVRVMNKLDAIDAGTSESLEEEAVVGDGMEMAPEGHDARLNSEGLEVDLGDDLSFDNWAGFGGDPAADGSDDSGETDAVAMGGLAMRKKDSLSADKTSDERVMKLIRQSRGAPIPGAVAERMGRAMGEDVSGARVHTDSHAAKAAELLNAKAFALGADIFFGEGNYAPGTKEGDTLFTHELAHVVQHQEGRLPTSSSESLEVSNPTDSAEVEAEAVAAEATIAMDSLDASEAAPSAMDFDGGVGVATEQTAMRSQDETEEEGEDTGEPTLEDVFGEGFEEELYELQAMGEESGIWVEGLLGDERIPAGHDACVEPHISGWYDINNGLFDAVDAAVETAYYEGSTDEDIVVDEQLEADVWDLWDRNHTSHQILEEYGQLYDAYLAQDIGNKWEGATAAVAGWLEKRLEAILAEQSKATEAELTKFQDSWKPVATSIAKIPADIIADIAIGQAIAVGVPIILAGVGTVGTLPALLAAGSIAFVGNYAWGKLTESWAPTPGGLHDGVVDVNGKFDLAADTLAIDQVGKGAKDMANSVGDISTKLTVLTNVVDAGQEIAGFFEAKARWEAFVEQQKALDKLWQDAFAILTGITNLNQQLKNGLDELEGSLADSMARIDELESQYGEGLYEV